MRQLYTDQDEVLFDAARPVILNGIEDIVERPDLADRALFLTLEPITESRRRSEADLWRAFEADVANILGALLDAVVEGLKRLPETQLPRLPRMADFALWAAACEGAFWPAGTFWSAYCSNRDTAVEGVIEADPVVGAVRSIMSKRTEWTGTATDLLGTLAGEVDERVSKSKDWPSSARALSGRLRRAATSLRKIGIDVALNKEGRARTRIVHITASATETAVAQPSAPSATSATPTRSGSGNGFGTAGRTNAGNTDDSDAATVRANSLETGGASAADDADENSLPESVPSETDTPRVEE